MIDDFFESAEIDSSESFVGEDFESPVSDPPAEDPPAAETESPLVSALPAAEETPLPVEDDAPPSAEEAPPPVEEDPPPPAEEEAPPAFEDEAPQLPVEDDGQVSSGGSVGGGGVDLDSALGSLTAFLDTRERLSNPELELSGIETFALSPITSSSGLKGILLDLIGPYDNIVTQYRYQQNTSSNYTYVNEVTPDYPWICSALLFIVLLWSVFRLLGRCFSWMK